MMLSKYVSLAEAIKSQTATRKGISNEPDEDQLEAMKHVSTNIYDVVKEKFPSAFVSSFFRSLALNQAIGGSSKTSQHMKGEAIDIDGDSKQNLEVFNFIKNNLKFDQLILEYPDTNGSPSWVHVSLKQNAKLNRGQVLVKLKDKYITFNDYKIGTV